MDMKKILIIAVLVIVAIVAISSFYFATGSADETTILRITSDENLTNGDVFSVKLTNENGSGIANKTINVNLTDSNNNTTSVNITTDSEGNGNFTINLDADNYSVDVCFAGDEKYAPSFSMQHLTIADVISQTTVQKSSSSSTASKYSSQSASSEDDDGIIYSTDPNSDKCVLDENGHIDQEKVNYYTKIAQEKYGPIG